MSSVSRIDDWINAVAGLVFVLCDQAGRVPLVAPILVFSNPLAAFEPAPGGW